MPSAGPERPFSRRGQDSYLARNEESPELIEFRALKMVAGAGFEPGGKGGVTHWEETRCARNRLGRLEVRVPWSPLESTPVLETSGDGITNPAGH